MEQVQSRAPKASAKSKAAAKSIPRKPFKHMSGAEKLVFIGMSVVCICTFGFVFPNLFES